MKLVSYIIENSTSLGVLVNNDTKIININQISNGELPNTMEKYIVNFDFNNLKLKNILNEGDNFELIDYNERSLKAPILNPASFRDAYAFRQHVEAGRKNRGLDMIQEYDEFPVFYFSNHHSICGPGDVYIQSEHKHKLDFEFEIAVLISNGGKNIAWKNAHNHIGGLMIMNDWSAREIQFKEMKLNLGPAKGKDFATSIGPYLVTLDELEDRKIISDDGIRYDLKMHGYINDELVSTDNFKNMSWTFSKIIERASYGVELFPGDIIGSGTCSTGCLLELNLTNNTNNWLNVGDEIKLTVDCLGSLRNKICLRD